jgi:hypothetical protein
MPVEFAVAVYRFGHGIIQPFYVISQSTLDRGGVPVFGQDGDFNLNGGRPIPAVLVMEWNFVLDALRVHLQDGSAVGLVFDTRLEARPGSTSVGMNITGLLIVILAVAVRNQLPRRRASRFAVALLALLGVALMLAAFRVDTPMLSGGGP